MGGGGRNGTAGLSLPMLDSGSHSASSDVSKQLLYTIYSLVITHSGHPLRIQADSRPFQTLCFRSNKTSWFSIKEQGPTKVKWTHLTRTIKRLRWDKVLQSQEGILRIQLTRLSMRTARKRMFLSTQEATFLGGIVPRSRGLEALQAVGL